MVVVSLFSHYLTVSDLMLFNIFHGCFVYTAVDIRTISSSFTYVYKFLLIC